VLGSGVGDKIEIVPGDSSYVIASAEADTYERTRCISGEIWEQDFLKVADMKFHRSKQSVLMRSFNG